MIYAIVVGLIAGVLLQLPVSLIRGAWQILRRKAVRNDPCPCGSGKKFKNCCMASSP